MDIKQLIYFLTITEEGSITKAAKKLHMAQPPLSHQLKLLEDDLEVKLIDRTTKKLQTTGAGEILQYRSEQILELVKTTIKELKNYNKEFQGTLSVGTVPSSGDVLLPKLFYALHEKYPGLNFQIREGDTYKIIDMLTKGIIDVGMVRTPFNSENFKSICLSNDPMVAIIKDNLYWNEKQKFISITDLINKPLIIDCRFERMITNSCKKIGYKPKILCECDNVRTILSLASTGIGVGIIPKSAIRLISSANLKYKEINEPSLETKATVLWLKNKPLSNIAKEFLSKFTQNMG